MNDNCKCKDCKNRHVGCHSTCEDYIKWSEENKKISETKSKQAYLNNIGYLPKRKKNL